MRTRKDIVEEVGDEARDQAIQIELLLDIRDLLTPHTEEKEG